MTRAEDKAQAFRYKEFLVWGRRRFLARNQDACESESVKLEGSKNRIGKADMRSLFSILMMIFVTGCAAPGSKGGFWGELDARKTDASFHLVRHVGSQKNCFPPITSVECVPLKKDEVLYEETKKLEMEEFSITLPSRDFFEQARIKDMLFLAAAELTIQRGFSMFTVTTELELSMCRTYGSDVNSSGSLNVIGSQGYYSGTTTVRPREICGGSKSMRVLMFNDKAPLAEGIFKRSNSGSAQWLYPERSLYFGTMPGLRYADYNRMPDQESRISTPYDAWKTHYDARGLASDMRSKYKLSEAVPISFRDELSENLKREAEDPLQRNKLVAP